MRRILFLIILLLLFSSFTSAALTDGIVSYWNTNETSGSVLRDSLGYMDLSASGNNASGVGKIGLINNSFNHSNLYSIKSNQSIDSKPLFNSSNFSIVLFYYGNSVSGGDFWVDGNWLCPTGAPSDGFQFDTNGGAEFRFIIGGSVYTFTGGLAKLNATTWNQVALTRSPSNITFYVNGLQVSSTGANTYGGLKGANCRITFGGYGRGDGPLNNRMDERSFYSRKITSAEVLDIYRNVSAGVPYPYVTGGPPPPSDTCTWSGTGNWFINATDNCTLAYTDLKGFNVSVMGQNNNDGFTKAFRNLTNYTRVELRYCRVHN